MAKCDLCGGGCKGTELAQLLHQYQVPGVVDVCPACEKWANKRKGELLAEIAPTLRAEISAKKIAEQGEKTAARIGIAARVGLAVRRAFAG